MFIEAERNFFIAGGFRSDLITPLLVGLFVNYYIKKTNYSWWKKYAYVLSAGLDSGSAIGLTLTFLFFSMSEYKMPFPIWFMNPPDVENCAPSYYLTCVGNEIQGSGYGRTYDIEKDEFCRNIHFGGMAVHN
jgi:hypothetical protein